MVAIILAAFKNLHFAYLHCYMYMCVRFHKRACVNMLVLTLYAHHTSSLTYQTISSCCIQLPQ